MIRDIVRIAAAEMGVTDPTAIAVAEGFLLASLIILVLKLLLGLASLILSIAKNH
ncbi:hypothetical protein AB4099_13245 [Bosea sp. 2KB_26]|uniref:hypothetical protein n=1 Tax=Bosea sp. 2KB_26 TaxID=3237475 RepID=UPI003F8E19AD